MYYKDLKVAKEMIQARDSRLTVGQLPSFDQGFFTRMLNKRRLEKTKRKSASIKAKLVQKSEPDLDLFLKEQDEPQFLPHQLLRDDDLPVDKTLDKLQDQIDNMPAGRPKEQMIALKSRTESVSNLTPKLYKRFESNPDALKNWFPILSQAARATSFFKVPATQTWDLPIELAQYLRLDFLETTTRSRNLFNQIIKDHFHLQPKTTYFLRTGTFSSKFQFANTKCLNADCAGEQFHLISNFAMQVGAGTCNDLTVREFIDDPENNPTIYNGMPLRTEFRAFIDLNERKLIGIVPYWNPIAMKRTLETQSNNDPDIKQDYETYLSMEDKLMSDFNASVPRLNREVKNLLPHIKGLTGSWSLDIMKSGDSYYLIDMATYEHSALTELLSAKFLYAQ